MSAEGGSQADTSTAAVAEAEKTEARQLEDLQMGDRLKGVVVSVLEGTTGKKAWVRVGVMRASKGGKFAFVDGMIRLSKEKGLKPRKIAVDKAVTVYVSKVVPAEGRLEVSLRPPKALKPSVDTSHLRPLADLALGDELQGVVQTVTQFAAFVSCGVGRPTKRLRPDGKPAVMEEVDGFLGKDDLPEDAVLSEQLVKSQDTNLIVSKGDRLQVFVKEVFPGNGRLRLTLNPNVTPEEVRQMKTSTQRQKAKFARRKDPADLVVGEEMLGDIVRAFEFGYFVDVGAKSNGLVHISSISEKEDRYLGDLNDFAAVGDKMYVRVNGLDEEGRLSLSYTARGQDRPTPLNRQQRRRESRGEDPAGADTNPLSASPAVSQDKAALDDDDGDDDGGFFSNSSPSGGNGVEEDDDDEDGYKSNIDYDIFDDM